MADVTLASAVALPDLESEHDDHDSPNHAGVKRAAEDIAEQENKRQRTSPGKDTPQPQDDGSQDPPTQQHGDESAVKVDTPQRRTEKKEARQTRPVDEKQRSKRLFGALLGNLNQPRDRTAKKRQEIESRRKAELQQQDDERIEDKQRRLEELVQQRKREQRTVDRENMRIRHRNLLDRANFLQTKAEPVLLYQPWTLRAEEEDCIQDQLDDAQAQVDREVAEFDTGEDEGPERGHAHGNGDDAKDTKRQTSHDTRQEKNGDAPRSPDTVDKPDDEIQHQHQHQPDQDITKEERNAVQQATNLEGQDDGSDHAVETEQTGETTHNEPTKDTTTHERNDAEDHVEEGDEDTVIY